MTDTITTADYALTFLGAGSGGNLSVGASAAVLERQGKPVLLIDCGPGTLNAYAAAYGELFNALPEAVFITHAHMDHIADLEILTVRARLSATPPIPLFVPVSLIPVLHQRLATYPGSMAEGDHDFWQSFQLRPVSDHFILGSDTYRLYPTRHHAPGSSYALHIPGCFFYSGDTRPIPELLHHVCQASDVIFHDCGVTPNPSHTGLDDLSREYRDDIRARLILYHYADTEAAETLKKAGYEVAQPGDRFPLGYQHANG